MSQSNPDAIRLGTRGSWLAMLQSDLVAAVLRRQGYSVELVTVVTEGDSRPIDMSPGVGVFVTALEQALLDGAVDMAVHSAKDVPLVMREGLAVVAFPGPREDPRDALVTRDGALTLDTLPSGATFGTDSPRRAGFVLHRRPDLRHLPLHGNVDTRLRRLGAGEIDALVLAAAGLDRLGSGRRIDQRIDPEVLPPAPGQGALAVQCRAEDDRVLAVLRGLDDPAVRLAVLTERRVLEATGGSCRAPVGALAGMAGGRLCLLAGAAAPDGSARCVVFLDADPTEAAGQRMAEQAGRELMQKVVSSVA
ncbi:MAG TPA: hydroxymethylbilane synthase [Candidatus Dormibacteraeota bacterium]